LLQRLREPDAEQAWARFVDLYTPLFFSWTSQLGLPEPEAAELVQDVLGVLMTQVRDFDATSSKNFRSWLRTVMMNQWYALCSRRSVPTTVNDEPSVDTVDINNSPEDYRKELMPRALQMLQPDFDATTWQACWEHVVRGRTADDIGAELKLSEAAVYAARYRVLQRLRQELDGMID
jgi:RNA polymerase sigma-70 factor (ECF subfamily)